MTSNTYGVDLTIFELSQDIEKMPKIRTFPMFYKILTTIFQPFQYAHSSKEKINVLNGNFDITDSKKRINIFTHILLFHRLSIWL